MERTISFILITEHPDVARAISAPATVVFNQVHDSMALVLRRYGR